MSHYTADPNWEATCVKISSCRAFVQTLIVADTTRGRGLFWITAVSRKWNTNSDDSSRLQSEFRFWKKSLIPVAWIKMSFDIVQLSLSTDCMSIGKTWSLSKALYKTKNSCERNNFSTHNFLQPYVREGKRTPKYVIF